MGNVDSCSKNCLPTVAHDVVTLGGRIAGIASFMPGADVTVLIIRSLNLHACQMRGMRSRVVEVVNLSCGMRRVVVPRSVRVCSDGAGEDQRKRRHGCNQPCRPCLALTTHVGS